MCEGHSTHPQSVNSNIGVTKVMTALLLARSVNKIFISSVRTDIIVSLMLDDPLQSFHPFEED
jgi:hypothetical protein